MKLTPYGNTKIWREITCKSIVQYAIHIRENSSYLTVEGKHANTTVLLPSCTLWLLSDEI